MFRNADRSRRRVTGAAGLLALMSAFAVVAVSSDAHAAIGRPGARTAGGTPTSQAVATALVDAFGVGATVDDSSTTGCMGADPEPLAYRSDRIILRPPPSMATADALDLVAAVLRAEMGPGTFDIGVPETITWDPASDPGLPAPAAGERSSSGPLDAPLIWRVVSVPIESLNHETVPIVTLARRLRALDLAAAPDYLLSPSSGPLGVWPNGPPLFASQPHSPRPGLGGGATVMVYDTGVPDPAEANIPANLSRLTAADVEIPDRDGDHYADMYYTGHLTAIGGILATLAPDSTVKGVRITGDNGVATDFSAAKRMAGTLHDADRDDTWPTVIVNSFGSPACSAGTADPGEDLVPLGLQMVAEAVDRNQQAVVVAAAGNRGTNRPFYPAAFNRQLPSIISVGALDAGGADGDADAWTSPSRSAQPASFSNYGPWIDAWAPGVALATYHVIGLRFGVNGPKIDGFALASGTSFATPYVGGLIAEQVARTGQTPWDAWQDVRDSGSVCSQHTGVALALTAITATSTTMADPLLPTLC